MSLPNVETVALRIAVVLKRAELARARLSDMGFRRLSERQVVRSSFKASVVYVLLNDLGIICVELASGGFGLLKISSLEGAKSLQATRLLPRAERRKLTIEQMYQELGFDDEVDEFEDFVDD